MRSCLTSCKPGALRAKLSRASKGGSGELIFVKVMLPQPEAESLKTDCALRTSQFSAIAGRGEFIETESIDEAQLESCRRAAKRSWSPGRCWLGAVVGGRIPMCSGFETVLLLRGLTGSYSHRRPLSRHRSHCGRSSLHFFFFLLLHWRAISNTARSAGLSKKKQRTNERSLFPWSDIQSQPRISSRDTGFSLDPNGLTNQSNQVVEKKKKKKNRPIYSPALERRLGNFAGTGRW